MTEPTPGVAAFETARAAVLDRIAAACERASAVIPPTVTLVAVSKTVDAERLRDAVAAGLTLLGENRVQEGVTKAPEVPGARWHLIGPLQSNKARRALEVFDVIQSVDSVSLAERLDRLAREVRGAGPADRYPILLQVNVDDDPAKAGFEPSELPGALRCYRGPRRAGGPRPHDDRSLRDRPRGGTADVPRPARPGRPTARRWGGPRPATCRWA